MGKLNHFFCNSLKTGMVATLFLGSLPIWADDALTLPQGRWRVRWASTFTVSSNEYGSTGDIRSIGSTYSKSITGKLLSGLTPNASRFVQALNAMQPGFGDSLAIASLNAEVESEFWTNVFAAEYGVTDRLSLGVIMPLVHAEIEVRASSEPSQEFNALMKRFEGQPQMQAQFNQVLAGTSVQGLNSILRSQFGYNAGLTSWNSTGIGDIEVGGKYNYFKDTEILATVKTGLRLPTGRTDDPDNLVDVGFGDGQFDLGVYNYVDYRPTAYLSFTHEVGYVAQLPDTNSYRVPVSAELPIGSPAIELDRRLGDYWETGLEANYTMFKLFTTSAKYRFKQKFKDSYDGVPTGFNAALLTNNTNEILHEGQFQVEYSNLSRVRAGLESFPFAVAVLYRQPFHGENVSDSRTAGVQLKSYF